MFISLINVISLIRVCLMFLLLFGWRINKDYSILSYSILIQTGQLYLLAQPESIECHIEDQAFSPSYDRLIPPTLTPYPVSEFSLVLSLPECRRSIFEGAGGRARTKPCDGEKSWFSINYSISAGLSKLLDKLRHVKGDKFCPKQRNSYEERVLNGL